MSLCNALQCLMKVVTYSTTTITFFHLVNMAQNRFQPGLIFPRNACAELLRWTAVHVTHVHKGFDDVSLLNNGRNSSLGEDLLLLFVISQFCLFVKIFVYLNEG